MCSPVEGPRRTETSHVLIKSLELKCHVHIFFYYLSIYIYMLDIYIYIYICPTYIHFLNSFATKSDKGFSSFSMRDIYMQEENV